MVSLRQRLRAGSPAAARIELAACTRRQQGTLIAELSDARFTDFAGVAQWQSPSLPSWPCRFDPGRPLHRSFSLPSSQSSTRRGLPAWSCERTAHVPSTCQCRHPVGTPLAPRWHPTARQLRQRSQGRQAVCNCPVVGGRCAGRSSRQSCMAEAVKAVLRESHLVPCSAQGHLHMLAFQRCTAIACEQPGGWQWRCLLR
jgi:hypothetical protein